MTDPVTPSTGSGRPGGSAEPPATGESPESAGSPKTTASSDSAARETAVLPLNATIPFPISEADTEVLPFDTTDRSGNAETEVLPAEPVIPEFAAFTAPRESAMPLAPSAAASASATPPSGSTPPPAPPTPTAPTAPTAPAYAAPGATAPETWPTAPARRRHPLFGTIFWGTVMLAFSGFIIYRTIVPGETDPALWLLGGVILMGLVLIVAGIAAAARRAT